MSIPELVMPPIIERWSSWFDSDRLERLTPAVVAGALLIGVVSLLAKSAPWHAYLPIVCLAAGWAIGRRWRAFGLALILAAPLVAALVTGTPVLTWTLTLPALFLFVLQGMPAVWVGLAGAVCNYLALYLASRQPLGAIAGLALATSIAAATTGAALKARREVKAEIAERAKQADYARELELQRRVNEERLRIARDLHDSVGHQIAVLNMHLGAAEVRLPPGEASDPARKQIRAARQGVQGVLTETQRILEILRISPEETLAPTADFAHLPDLVESFRNGGLDVDADICEEPSGLAAEVGAACYRVVQESLTNAHKHGDGHVRLRVARQDDDLTISVSNVARNSPGPGSGFGLVGMRSRVESVNGILMAGQRASTFEICAQLPIRGGGR